MALAIPYSLLTEGLYNGIIFGISGMTCKAVGIVKTIYSHNNTSVNEKLIQLDGLIKVDSLKDKLIENNIKKDTLNTRQIKFLKSINITSFNTIKSNNDIIYQLKLDNVDLTNKNTKLKKYLMYSSGLNILLIAILIIW